MTSGQTQTGKLGLALSMGILAALFLAAPAQAADADLPPGPGRHLDRMVEHLDLRADQEQELRELFTERHETRTAEMTEMRAARDEVRRLVQAETMDEAAIREASARVAALEADLAVERARFHQEVRKILDDEQLALFKEMHEKRRERMSECRGEGRGPHGYGRHHGRHGRGPGPYRGGRN